jgi:hypothetical protein
MKRSVKKHVCAVCDPTQKKKNVYIKLAEAVSMRCEETQKNPTHHPPDPDQSS